MRSGFERTLAADLKKRKVAFEYETVKVPYVIKHIYNPDFLILDNGILIEAKGYFRPGDVAKMRAVKAQNPDLDIRFVFMSAHKRIPGQKQTHAEWATRHGFPWADAKIPDDWTK
jgi:predicted nuclease of restriction endonuclease-like RecB superfamily